jgi:hypothetical protein
MLQNLDPAINNNQRKMRKYQKEKSAKSLPSITQKGKI